MLQNSNHKQFLDRLDACRRGKIENEYTDSIVFQQHLCKC